MPQYAHLDGFDPLAADDYSGTAALSQVFEDSRKRDVQNILKSYTGTFDLFSELLQNSLDAVQARQRQENVSYEPTIGIFIHMPYRLVRQTYNAITMNQELINHSLRPPLSFKRQ